MSNDNQQVPKMTMPDCELHFEQGKLSAVICALRSVKDSIETKVSEEEDSILWGCIMILEDIVPRLYEIKEEIEFYVPSPRLQ